MRSTLHVLTVGPVIWLLLGAPVGAGAETSSERARITETSARDALGGRTVALLEVVVPEDGREGQVKRLMELVGRSDREVGRVASSNRSTILFAADESWQLEVIGDGSRFRYRGNIDDPRRVAADAPFGRLDMATLEQLGRGYIIRHLAPLVHIPEDQQLIFLGTKYLRSGSATADEGFTSEVVSNIAVFGRAVHGTYIAGPGSKITVWFTNRGTAIAFNVDWPTYRVLRQQQETLDIAGVRNRIASYADKPELIEPNMRRFECGYVDLGVFKRQGAVIQAGCVVHHSGTSSEGFTYAHVETVPIGARVIPDPAWPVTGFVAAGRRWDPCRVSRQVCQEPQVPRQGRGD
jgi:hypothetical protein